MTSSINLLVKIVLNNYFNANNYVYYLSNEDIGNMEHIPLIIYNINTINKMQLENNTNGIIIFGSQPVNILEQIEYKYKHATNSKYGNERKYLIINATDNDIKYIFNSYSLHFIDKLLILKLVKNDKYCYRNITCCQEIVVELITHKYVGISEHNKEILLDVWYGNNMSFKYGNNLYPNKLSNQEGRVLTAATFNYIPYSIPAKQFGTEYQLISEYAKLQNNTLKVLIYNAEEWGNIIANFSGTGVFGSVTSDTSDLGFSAIFQWISKYWYIDYTNYYMNTQVSCIVPDPRYKIGWTTLFPHFSLQLTLTIATTFVIAMLALSAQNLFKTYQIKKHKLSSDHMNKIFIDWFFYTINILFQEGFKTNIQKFSVRLIICLLFLLSILTQSMFSSSLSSKMTVPSSDGDIRTVADFARSNLKWVGTQSSAWVESIECDESEIYKQIVSKFKEYKEFREPPLYDVAYSIERLQSGYCAIEDFITEKMLKRLKLMSEDLYNAYVVLITRKNSVLLPSLNKFILRTQEAGLNTYWETYTVVHYTNVNRQTILKYNKKTLVKKLTLNHCKGLFLLWGIGCFISIACFIKELYFM